MSDETAVTASAAPPPASAADFASAAEVLEAATEQAGALIDVVKKQRERKLVHNLGGGKHLAYEAWLLIARFNGTTPMLERIDEVREGDTLMGYRATVALVRTRDGVKTNAASAFCGLDAYVTKGQRSTGDKHNAAISMAQTRASSKVCRLAYAHVVVLAGYDPTPAEEAETRTAPRTRAQPKPKTTPSNVDDAEAEEVVEVGERDAKDRLICAGRKLTENEDGPVYGAHCLSKVAVDEEIIVYWANTSRKWPALVSSVERENADGSCLVMTKPRPPKPKNQGDDEA